MADDDVTPTVDDDALDEVRFDEQPFPDVQTALAGLAHLDPARAADDPMPEWAWDRLSAAIGAEAAVRAAATHDNVVLLPTAATETAAHRPKHSRATRWGGGLVAAGVTVLAIGVGVTALQGATSRPSPVAGNRLPPAAAAPLPASTPADATLKAPGSPEAFAAAAAPSESTEAAADVARAAIAPTPSAVVLGDPTAPAVEPRSAVVQAARMVTDTGTAYQHEQLPEQVTALLDSVGVQDATDISAVPLAKSLPPEDGFTETWATLRDCITWLTKETDSQAVVVDRGTFEGDEAGVVVAPADPLMFVDPSTPAPTLSMDTSAGRMDVWVVTPQCEHAQSSIEEYLPLQLQP